MLERLKSRKFWVNLVTILLVVFAGKLGVDLSSDQLMAIVGVASSYLLGQSYVDRAQVTKGAQSVAQLIEAAKETAGAILPPKSGDA